MNRTADSACAASGFNSCVGKHLTVVCTCAVMRCDTVCNLAGKPSMCMCPLCGAIQQPHAAYLQNGISEVEVKMHLSAVA